MRLRRGRTPAAALILALGLAGCGTEADPIRSQNEIGAAHPNVAESEFLHGAGGVNTQVGQVLLRDVSLDEPPDNAYEAGDIARLRVVLLNQAPERDALVEVSTPAAAESRLLVDRDCDGTAERLGEVLLPPQPPINTPAPTPADGPEVYYRVDLLLDEPLRSGTFIPVTFTFRNAGSTTVQVPVELDGLSERDDDAECEPFRP